ncbi:uncharacterized protein LOC125666969 isoform X2 [Ostrea edulis]|uniref:uncharacterized protein LOC125666969 isoform X2 n=1 Tax=Ostrea edulis TaxID=37623 RepID=UPI0024AE9D80|nr:uncharacterized protein LOC125666969 isoform X2 [Ostrea edulis]
MELEDILDQISLPDISKRPLREGLHHAKQYLKSQYKMHIAKESLIPDQCISHALSVQGQSFTEACHHGHSSICQDCEKMDMTLKQIQRLAEEQIWKNKEATMFVVDEAVSAIHKWKAHILRSKNQERARTCIIDKMTEGGVLVTCDWAMKFLPRKYREGQIDWFAKRGIN